MLLLNCNCLCHFLPLQTDNEAIEDERTSKAVTDQDQVGSQHIIHVAWPNLISLPFYLFFIHRRLKRLLTLTAMCPVLQPPHGRLSQTAARKWRALDTATAALRDRRPWSRPQPSRPTRLRKRRKKSSLLEWKVRRLTRTRWRRLPRGSASDE